MIHDRLTLIAARRTARWGALRRPMLLVAATLAAPASAQLGTNLLVDPGFESNTLAAHTTVLNNFVAQQGVWGVEVANITGAVGGVSPAAGSNMLALFDDGLVVTQAWQVTDVTSFAALIDANNAQYNLRSLFNVENAPNAIAQVIMQFFTGPSLGLEITPQSVASLAVDNDPSTWETIALSGAIPVGTRWMVSQVLYNNQSMGGQPGYVDNAYFEIVPSPGPAALLALAGACAARRRRAPLA